MGNRIMTPDEPNRTPPRPPAARRTRILVVEDDFDLRSLIQLRLDGAGLIVECAGTGAEAIQIVRRHDDLLMLLDYQLPDMSVHDLIAHLAREGRDVPFIIMTGRGDERVAVDMMKAGARDYLVKNLSFLGRLCPVVEHVLDRMDNQRRLAQAEADLADRTATLRGIYEAAPVGIGVTTDGILVDVNAFLCGMVGTPRGEVLGREVRWLFASPEEFDQTALADPGAGDGAGPLTRETRWRRADGSFLDILLTVSSPERTGSLPGRVFTAQDLSERRAAERERERLESTLRQQQKLESIGTLASGVAHEINNPIMAVMNYAQLILDQAPEDAPILPFAEAIIRENERVATIVRNLLSFARPDSDSRTPACVADMLEETLSLVRAPFRKENIAIEVNLPAILAPVLCRRQQIQQIFLNLLTNARDALNEKYPGAHPDKVIRIAAREDTVDGGQRVHIVFENHGADLPPELADRIFDPFFSTKPRDKGTGLGLAISFRIASQHQGHLQVQPLPGLGARFLVDLPAGGGG
jgi:PAS domain S-box-containing protein